MMPAVVKVTENLVPSTVVKEKMIAVDGDCVVVDMMTRVVTEGVASAVWYQLVKNCCTPLSFSNGKKGEHIVILESSGV